MATQDPATVLDELLGQTDFTDDVLNEACKSALQPIVNDMQKYLSLGVGPEIIRGCIDRDIENLKGGLDTFRDQVLEAFPKKTFQIDVKQIIDTSLQEASSLLDRESRGIFNVTVTGIDREALEDIWRSVPWEEVEDTDLSERSDLHIVCDLMAANQHEQIQAATTSNPAP